VTKLFGSVAALRGVDARFEAGRITVLEGPNGAGKTTLLAIAATALRPTSGTVSYEPLGSDPAAMRRELGWVAHESHCYGDLGGRANVELVARLRGLDAAKAWRSVAERIGCEALADQSVRTLSRGQRQRIALARALAHAPSVLLLDEPTTGLDSAGTELLERVLRQEAERGAVVVVVSHGAGVAERLRADRLRLEGGRVRPGVV
jgi:heme exporter protein A